MQLIFGVFGFCLFILFDLNKINKRSRLFNLFFPLGVMLLAVSVALCVMGNVPSSLNFFHWLCLAVMALSGIALIYTLFFALPFESTYVETNQPALVNRGVYGACRHPGFWPFFLFFLFLWLFFKTKLMFLCFIIYSICDLIYIFLQDRYFFPKYISGYDRYKTDVPFLIPSISSIRTAFFSK